MLIQQGTALTVTFGAAVLILPVIGVWFLWKNTQFVTRANQLATELEAEGGLPVDELERDQYGRILRDSADEVFARRKAETQDAPGDWRSWFRLAVAYHDARDTPRPARPCSGPSPCTADRAARACPGRLVARQPRRPRKPRKPVQAA